MTQIKILDMELFESYKNTNGEKEAYKVFPIESMIDYLNEIEFMHYKKNDLKKEFAKKFYRFNFGRKLNATINHKEIYNVTVRFDEVLGRKKVMVLIENIESKEFDRIDINSNGYNRVII